MPEAIRKGFEAIKPGEDYEPLADAARGRSRLRGRRHGTFSRAYTLHGDERAWDACRAADACDVGGACQRPCGASCPKIIWKVIATFRPSAERRMADAYEGTWVRDVEEIAQTSALPSDGVEAGGQPCASRPALPQLNR